MAFENDTADNDELPENPWNEYPFSFADTKVNSINNFMIPNIIETQPYI